LIRCHGAHLNTYLAAILKKKLNIPYVVSLHINPDVNVRGNASNFKDKFIGKMLKKIEKIGLRSADLVMPVYEPIVPFLKRLQIKNYEVCYNVLNDTKLTQKKDYILNSPIKVLSVGRQIAEKNPENLIRSLKDIPNIELTLIGHGEYNKHLKNLVHDENLSDRIKFIPSIANDELCKLYGECDFMALHTEYFEFSKVMIESFLVGLPLLVNYRSGDQVPELDEEICIRVENSVEGYWGGLKKLITDHSFRETIGKNAYQCAQALWNPVRCEQKYVDIYKKYMIQ
jgi:glycosyltransferase involved in cell wall biosynthesis